MLLDEVALDALLGSVPAIKMLTAIKEAPLNHPNGRLPADPHLERSVCNRQGFRLVAGLGHVPYLVRLTAYTPYTPFHVKQLSSVSQNSQEGIILVAPEGKENADRRDPAFGERVISSLLRVRTLPGKRAFNQRRVLDEVSEALGRERYASSVCTNWKHGMVPSRDTIRELARVLEVRPGWLAFGEGEMRVGETGTDISDIRAAGHASG